MSGERVLVVEDTEEVRQGLVTVLRDAGYSPRAVADGRDALREFYDFQPALLLLDIGLPGLSGLEVCQRVRTMSNVPVIVLSGRDGETTKIEAFENGADDYMVKGVSVHELLARVSATLRRAFPGRQTVQGDRYQNGELDVNFADQTVSLGGAAIDLTPIEFRLFAELVRHGGAPVSRRDLLAAIWGPEFDADYLVKWHVSRLRKKLSYTSNGNSMITTRRGFGYVFHPVSNS